MSYELRYCDDHNYNQFYYYYPDHKEDTTEPEDGRPLALMYNDDGLMNGEFYVNDGKIWIIGYYCDGLKYGFYREYHDNGRLRIACTYFDNDCDKYKRIKYDIDCSDDVFDPGIKHGKYKEWYRDGMLYIEAEYNMGKYHGKYIEYHKNKKKYIEACYDNGILFDHYYEWYENGVLHFDISYQLNKSYYAIKEGGGKHGPYYEMYDNGEICVHAEYFSEGRDESLCIYYEKYDRNKKLLYRAHYKNDKIEDFKFIKTDGYKNIKLLENGVFMTNMSSVLMSRLCTLPDITKIIIDSDISKKDKSLKIYVCKNFMLDGIYEEYHLNGRPFIKRIFEKNKINGYEQVWYENGNLYSYTHYVNGVIHGCQQIWHRNGQLYSQLYYDNGIQCRIHHMWDKNGILRYERRIKHYNALKKWYENYQLQKMIYYDKDEDIRYELEYHIDGNKKRETRNCSSCTIYIKWYNSEQMKSMEYYDKYGSQRIGKYFKWRKNGSLQIKVDNLNDGFMMETYIE